MELCSRLYQKRNLYSIIGVAIAMNCLMLIIMLCLVARKCRKFLDKRHNRQNNNQENNRQEQSHYIPNY